jgi:pyruvate-formate lyase-activating enzyme
MTGSPLEKGSSIQPPNYGFYGRLSAEFPSQVIVDATEVCNLACVHCPHPAFKQSPHYAARYQSAELNAKLVTEVRDHGKGHVQYIRYTGEGEPLIHPQIFEMLSLAKRESGVLVSLTTNGMLLNDRRLASLLETGVDVVDISIDAYSPETYAKIRVNGDLEVTRANVERLLAATRSQQAYTKVVVSYVEQPSNRHETADFERYWRDQGADFVVVRRLHSAAGAVSEIAAEIHQIDAGATRRPCLYPWERITLNPRGELIFCPQDWTHGSVVSDYRHTTIRETWQGEFYRRLRQAHLTNDYSCHGFCGGCPDWKHTRWPGQGRSYANMIEEFKAGE